MAKRQQRSSFRTLEDVLNTEKEFSNLKETIKNYDIVETFAKIFPELSLIAQAVKVDKKVLFLRVENSVWKSELNFRKTLIVEKVDQYFNEQIIRTIKFL